jgi:hypothetical protein
MRKNNTKTYTNLKIQNYTSEKTNKHTITIATRPLIPINLAEHQTSTKHETQVHKKTRPKGDNLYEARRKPHKSHYDPLRAEKKTHKISP